jgi:hypothetical protein
LRLVGAFGGDFQSHGPFKLDFKLYQWISRLAWPLVEKHRWTIAAYLKAIGKSDLFFEKNHFFLKTAVPPTAQAVYHRTNTV